MADKKITQIDTSKSSVETVKVSDFGKPDQYPYSDEDITRIDDYFYFQQLFEGDHFGAFKQRINNEDFNRAYAKLRYIYVNFAGMISKIVADMLFGEGVKPMVEDKNVQAWLEDFWRENNLKTLFYESALGNSALGDALIKLRVGLRTPLDKTSTVILEQSQPNIYFPHIDGFNVNADPDVRELAWKVEVDKKEYLRREIHTYGMIFNEAYAMKGNKVEGKVALSELGLDLVDQQATGIDRHMLIHVPNWRIGSRWHGYSDYYDLDALFFAINNRISKVDNVLDKHTDPILMVPPGVIDEKGRVKKDARVIEIGEGEEGKPEYIVWDASLENAFKQIEKLVEFIYMIGEVSPDVLGMGKGKSDSGRALKFKLMRTLAKVNRKKLYYDRAIKEALYVAQLLAKAWGAQVNGKTFTWEPVVPDLVWQDGLPTDDVELIENEVKKVDAGLTSEKEAIMKIHQIDEDAAEEMLKEIKKDKEAKMPTPLDPQRNPFTKTKEPKPPKLGKEQ